MRRPTRVGPYRLERPLGWGGMGEVHLGVHEDTGVRHAVKLVHAPTAQLSGQALARFRREAEALARLDHPHVVRVHAAGEDGPWAWLAEELLSGGTLQERLAAGPLPPEEARRLALALAEGLTHAHERGVLHRDLKPLNVLFDEHGRPKLADFGLARLSDAAQRLTRSGDVLGTPAYMAPEQVRGAPPCDERTDVYGLGAVLFAALTGQPPFPAAGGVQTLAAVVDEPPPRPSSLRPEVPPELDAVCARALAKHPEQRFAGVGALAAALRGEAPRPAGRGALLALAAAVPFGLGLWLVVRPGSARPSEPTPTPSLAPVASPAPSRSDPSAPWRAALADPEPWAALEALERTGPPPPELAATVGERWLARSRALLDVPLGPLLEHARRGTPERQRLVDAVAALAQARALLPELLPCEELHPLLDAWTLSRRFASNGALPPDEEALLERLLADLPGEPSLLMLLSDAIDRDRVGQREERLRAAMAAVPQGARSQASTLIHSLALDALRDSLQADGTSREERDLLVEREYWRVPRSPFVAMAYAELRHPVDPQDGERILAEAEEALDRLIATSQAAGHRLATTHEIAARWRHLCGDLRGMWKPQGPR